jgi:hypothetical protein
MKYIAIVLMMVATGVFGDQRMETVGGFCHFITPEGFANNNDDNEVFASNCVSSIRQNQDGTGMGSTIMEIEYPAGAMPFVGEYEYTGDETGQECVMVDSNGTNYVTQDWTATYEAKLDSKEYEKFKKHFGKKHGKYDLNDDGIVNFEDLALLKQNSKGEIEYELACRNAAQQ